MAQGATSDVTLIPQGATPIVKVKTSDETVNSSTTLQNDDELLLAVDANTNYAFEAFLLIVSDITPDFKAAFTVPTGATLRWYGASTLDTATFPNAYDVDALVTSSGTSKSFNVRDTTERVLRIHGSVRVAGTAGNLQLQWAQNTSNAANTTVKSGSWLYAVQA